MPYICIYPEDSTTSFLKPIYETIETTNTGSLYPIKTFDDSDKAFEVITNSEEGTLIIFMGHGTSKSLYDGNREEFIENKDFHIFKGKRLFLLACRSREFITANKYTIPLEYIGFGNMVTDWSEVEEERKHNAKAYPNLTESIVTKYKELLTEAIKADISVLLEESQNFKYYFNQLKMRLNRSICTLLLQKDEESLQVAYMLDKTKKEIIVGGSKYNF